MTAAKPMTRYTDSGDPATSRLEDLIPIAVAVAAGCERCAERTVQRALGRGNAKEVIAHTLQIVARIRSLECFADAVPPEVLARMDQPLQAGRNVLASAAQVPGERGCCG